MNSCWPYCRRHFPVQGCEASCTAAPSGLHMMCCLHTCCIMTGHTAVLCAWQPQGAPQNQLQELQLACHLQEMLLCAHNSGTAAVPTHLYLLAAPQPPLCSRSPMCAPTDLLNVLVPTSSSISSGETGEVPTVLGRQLVHLANARTSNALPAVCC